MIDLPPGYCDQALPVLGVPLGLTLSHFNSMKMILDGSPQLYAVICINLQIN